MEWDYSGRREGMDKRRKQIKRIRKEKRKSKKKSKRLEMWANAQRDGHPAEHRWRPLFNTSKFG